MMSRQMKASGVSWMGSVPATWTPIRADSLFTKLKRVQHNQKVLSLSYGKIINKKVTNDGLVPANYDTYQGVNPGDIVLRLTDLQNDEKSIRVAHSDITGIITSAYLSLKAKKVVLPLFGYFLLHTAGDINKLFYSLGGGVRQTMKFNDIARLSFVIPSFKEQVAITKYLDDRTTAIDSKIQLLEEKSKSLAELRKSVVHQAVTKGLNANAVMKPSGVDWIGDVPAHWSVLRGKNFLQYKKELNHAKMHSRIWSLTLDGVRENDPDNPIGMVPSDYGTYQLFDSGDFVFKLIDLENYRTSRFGIVPGPGIMSSAYMRMKVKKGDAGYLKWVFLDMWRLAVFNSYGSNGVRSNLTYSDMYNMLYAFPSEDEQKEIASYLEQRMTIIDASIKTIADQIAAMKSLRQSLIHEAVTGKIDVADYGYHYA